MKANGLRQIGEEAKGSVNAVLMEQLLSLVLQLLWRISPA